MTLLQEAQTVWLKKYGKETSMKKAVAILLLSALVSGCSARHFCPGPSSMGAASAGPGGAIIVGGATLVCLAAKGVEALVSDEPDGRDGKKAPEKRVFLPPDPNERIGPTVDAEYRLIHAQAEAEAENGAPEQEAVLLVGGAAEAEVDESGEQ